MLISQAQPQATHCPNSQQHTSDLASVLPVGSTTTDMTESWHQHQVDGIEPRWFEDPKASQRLIITCKVNFPPIRLKLTRKVTSWSGHIVTIIATIQLWLAIRSGLFQWTGCVFIWSFNSWVQPPILTISSNLAIVAKLGDPKCL